MKSQGEEWEVGGEEKRRKAGTGQRGSPGEERERKVNQKCSRGISPLGQGPNLIAWQRKKPSRVYKTGSHVHPTLIFLPKSRSPCHSFSGGARGLQRGRKEGVIYVNAMTSLEADGREGRKKLPHPAWPLTAKLR